MKIAQNDLVEKCTIIVMSCDAYSDVWGPFAQCWTKFWPNCPFEIYLISEKKEFIHPMIKNMLTGERMNWGRMMHFVFENIETPYLLYLQEDYLLRSAVDESMIINMMSIFEEEGAAYLRLLPWPGPDEPHPKYDKVGVLNPDSKYRTSLQAAIWRKEVLEQLVDINDDGRFESWSIQRAMSINRLFLCLYRNGIDDDINHDGDYPLNYFATSVFQGKWLKEAVRLYKSLGIRIDTSHRGVMNRIDFLEYHLRKSRKNSLLYQAVLFTKKAIDRF